MRISGVAQITRFCRRLTATSSIPRLVVRAGVFQLWPGFGLGHPINSTLDTFAPSSTFFTSMRIR